MVALFGFSVSATVAAQNAVATLELEQLDQMLAETGRRNVVVVLAAWCAPCIEELPALNQLYQKYRAEGMNLMGISLDYGGPEAIQPVVDQHNVRFPVYWVGEKAITPYDIQGIPLILLVKNGKIIEKISGKRDMTYLDQRFAEFMKQP